MRRQGFVITKSRARQSFFTASSAYDTPRWIGVDEATIYTSETQADHALKRLYAHGAYEAFAMPLEEAYGREDDVAPLDSVPLDDAIPDDTDIADLMHSDDQESVCPDCEHDPCTCPADEDADVTDDVEQLDTKLSRQDEEVAHSLKQFVAGQRVTYGGKQFDVISDEGTGHVTLQPTVGPKRPITVTLKSVVAVESVTESFSIPTASQTNTQSENDTTATDLPTPPEIEYHTPGARYDLGDTAILSQEKAVTVPADVLSDLTSAIAEIGHRVDVAYDDTAKSFWMTVSDALTELQRLLKEKTPESIKQAQIHMSTLMSPITGHIPDSVSKYILRGGRPPSLSDRFTDAFAKKLQK